MRDVLELQIILHSHPETEISFKFIPKTLMSKECIHIFGPLCIYVPHNNMPFDAGHAHSDLQNTRIEVQAA